MSFELFRATTLKPASLSLSRPLIERPRVLESLNLHPSRDTLNWMIAPIGAGKTTAALQWVKSLNTDVQYVSATTQPFSPASRAHAPDEFGVALRDLLNACSRREIHASRTEIAVHLDRILTLCEEYRRSFIVDDLHFISSRNMDMLLDLFGPEASRLRVNHALFISRTINSSVLSKLRSLRPLRLVLPDALELDSAEAVAAHQAGVFGNATAGQVEAARIESNGWISGMQVSLHGHGGSTVSPAAFRSSLLNDLLLDQPPAILQIMLASANLPYIYGGIWKEWFDHYGLPQSLIPSMASQLPTQEICSREQSISFPPPMKSALQYLTNVSMPEGVLDELLIIALKWLIKQGMFEVASQLAADHQLLSDFLVAIKGPCTRLAETESWSEIYEILKHIPQDVLTQDADLTYWYLHALVERDLWQGSRDISERCLPDWLESSHPVVRARAELLQSWNMHMLNHADRAVELSTSAYNTFPESANVLRMWAAGTASIANSLRGNWAEANRWTALANFETTFTHIPSRWWHNNARPQSYSWMCINGLMYDAYSLSGQQIHSLEESAPALTTRYRLLQAQIEIEMLNLDAGERMLDEAQDSLDAFYSQHHNYLLVRANLARIRGDYGTARDFLAKHGTPTRQRFDQYTREVYALANIALDDADFESAEYVLATVAPGERVWPKHFGDVHPELIRAMLLYAYGNVDEAISVTHSTLREAEERTHTYYVVRALAILAYIYHHTDQSQRWRESVQIAQRAAGTSGYQAVFHVRTEDVRKLGDLPTKASYSPDIAVDRNNTAFRLTSREVEVLELVARSLSNKEIAGKLFISVSTVKNHLASVYDKLGANRRAEAVKIARSRGLIR